MALLFAILFAWLPLSFGFKEREIVRHLLADYDKYERPNGRNDSRPDGGPVVVTTNMYLRSIYGLDDRDMKYTVQITLRGEWFDDRLAFESLRNATEAVPDYVKIPKDESKGGLPVWTPDTFVQNERSASRHEIPAPNILIRVYPDGSVLYSERLTFELHCPKSLEYFPFDGQACLLDLASYSKTADDVEYKWKAERPVQQKDDLRQSLPSYEIVDVLHDYCTSRTNTGTYSCLRVKLVLRRESSAYVLQLYIPSTMLVIVAWLSFALDKNAVAVRLQLCFGSLALIVVLSLAVNWRLPHVSYYTAVDVWVGVCLVYVFYALLETAIVSRFAGRTCARREQYNALDQSATPIVPPPVSNIVPEHRISKLDTISLVVYPVSFVLYIAYYAVRYAF